MRLSDFLVYLAHQLGGLTRGGMIAWSVRSGRRESARTIHSMLTRLVRSGRLHITDGIYHV
jgi:hypothetical protein